MKKILFVPLSPILLTGTVYAQSQQVDQKMEQNALKKHEHLMMKNGSMLHSM
jgi:hypothetical protein